MAWLRTDLPVDAATSPLAVELGGRRLLLLPLADGWSAVEDRCSHAGCPFSTDGRLDADVLVCDCHGSEFDPRTGAVLRSPAQLPVRVFETRVTTDGWLEVRL
jgi:3-phenylpropionate/trans-cinnamate dioxygenase ferredoxin subunit